MEGGQYIVEQARQLVEPYLNVRKEWCLVQSWSASKQIGSDRFKEKVMNRFIQWTRKGSGTVHVHTNKHAYSTSEMVLVLIPLKNSFFQHTMWNMCHGVTCNTERSGE